MKTLLLIDGNAIMHRAFFAIPPFETKKGIPTNMIHGFFTMLQKSIADFQPTHVIITFDTPKPTFRVKLLKTYQAQRPKVKDEFVVQIPYIRQLIDLAGITRLEKDGYEADDVIGTVANHYKKSMRVFILTGDKDILQLVDENVFVVAPLIGISKIAVYNIEEVEKRMGVKPALIPDLKALIGDPSDNYTGAKGIGPKTAINLLVQFITVENLLKRIDSIDNEKIKKILKESKKNIILSKKLATIICDVDVKIDLEKTVFNGFNSAMQPLLEELELHTVARRLFQTQPIAIKKPEEPKKSEDSSDQIGLF